MDGDAGEGSSGGGHFGKASKGEIASKLSLLHFAPGDCAEVAGYQSNWNVGLDYAAEKDSDTRADAAAEVGTIVEALGFLDDDGKVDGDIFFSNSGCKEHGSDEIEVEHAVGGDKFQAGFVAGYVCDGRFEGSFVVWASPADEGSIDVEEDQAGG